MKMRKRDLDRKEKFGNPKVTRIDLGLSELAVSSCCANSYGPGSCWSGGGDYTKAFVTPPVK